MHGYVFDNYIGVVCAENTVSVAKSASRRKLLEQCSQIAHRLDVVGEKHGELVFAWVARTSERVEAGGQSERQDGGKQKRKSDEGQGPFGDEATVVAKELSDDPLELT